MGHLVAHLYHLIEGYGLADRSPAMAQLKVMLEQNMVSEGLARSYLAGLQGTIDHLQDYPNLLHRPPTESQWYANGIPDIPLGHLVEAPDLRFGFDLRGAQHTGMIGQTNSGKTIGLRNVIFAADGWPKSHPGERLSVLCDDSKGGDFADIPGLLGNNWRHLSVHGSVKLGTNGPRNVPPRVWINHLSMWLAIRAGLKASAICIANMMKFAVAALNPVPQKDLLWPSFPLLLDIAKAAPLSLFAEKPDYERSLMQVLAAFEQEEMFHTLNGLDVERDIVGPGLSVVFDTCGMSPPWARLLWTDILIGQMLLARQFAFRKTNRIDTLFLIDEADVLVSRSSEESFPAGAMSPVSQCQKQAREAGVALFLGCSALGPVARQVLTNMNNLFLFRVKDPESLREAQLTFLLRHGGEAILPGLENGTCLVRTSNGWSHAVLGQFHSVPPSRVSRPDRFDQHPYVPGKRLHELPLLQEALDRLIAEHRRALLRRGRKQQPDLPDYARKLLELAFLHPYAPVARLWQKIGQVPPAAQAIARKELEDRALASFKEIRNGKRNQLLIWIEEKGWQFLDRPPPKKTGRGGIDHSHFCHWLKAWALGRGHKAQTEWLAPGTNHPTDVAYEVDGAWHIFEVVCGSSDNLIGHLHACLVQSQAVSTVTIVTSQKGFLKDLQARVSSDLTLMPFANRIHFDVIENYMPKESTV